MGKLQQDYTAHIDQLWDIIHTKYEHELSYYKVWDVKQKATAKIFEDWEQSYQRLRKLLLAYLDQDLGTQYSYHTIPRPYKGIAYCAMYIRHSLHALLHSNIVGQ